MLHPPRKEEQALIDAAIDRGVAVFDLILADNMAAAMHKLHTKPKPQTRASRAEQHEVSKRASPSCISPNWFKASNMSLKCGIVGLPNVGKSTLFNALTKAGIAAENYPFCTIEPNVGIVEVPDPRLAQLVGIAKPQKSIPAVVEFVDIAGPGRRRVQGRGPGQQVPRQHPRNRRHRPRGALLRRRQRRPRRRQDRSAGRHRDHQHRTRAGRPRDGGKDHAALRQGRRGRATRRRSASWRGAGKSAAGARTRPSPRAASTLVARGAAAAASRCS